MADEQHDPTQPLDPTQPASSIPAGSPTADQPPAEPTDAGSSAPPFVQNPQAPVPNSSAPGATAEPTNPIAVLAAQISRQQDLAAQNQASIDAAAPEATTVQPIHVDQRTRRSDDDALEGHFVDIIDGDSKGRRGTFDRVTEYGTDGYPKRILVITRDERNEPLDVPYEYARPTTYLGGR